MIARLAIALAAAAALLALAQASHARWKPEYASQPQAVQDWYQNAELTEAAQKRLRFKSCCAHSDVVRTRFRVNKIDGRSDEWQWLDGSTWRAIPPDIIHWGEHAPDGQPTLFVFTPAGGGAVETCFYPPDGGI